MSEFAAAPPAAAGAPVQPMTVAASDPVIPAVAGMPANPNSEILTAKLQKLAMDRQKGNLAERLKIIQSNTASHLASLTTFQEMQLPPHLLSGIFGMGFDKPSAIQAYALPRILAEPPQSLIAQAQSGSGKTAAFVLGMLYRVTVDTPCTTQALCVTPTRELAVQIVQNCLVKMAANITGLRTRMALAGEMIDRGETANAHIVVGTPGKVCDWLKRKMINAKTIKVLVLDEADEMCNESSHRANSLLIRKAVGPQCQTLFFSATFPGPVLEYAEKLAGECDKILIASDEELVLDEIKQIWIDTEAYAGGKLKFLEDMYSLMTIGQSIVFVESRREVDAVAKTLNDQGFACSALHGKIENEQRDALMNSFRNGETQVLITTNVLARGVDVDNVCLVVNYDMPKIMNMDRNAPIIPDYETYLHRIGRTGRFGKKGTAINLVSDMPNKQLLAQIEQHFSPNKEMIQLCKPDAEALADMLEVS